VIIDEDAYLAHYGTLHKSGRYPWGSGKKNELLDTTLGGSVAMLKQRGLSEAEIARGFGMTTTQLRAAKAIEKARQKQTDISTAQRLRDKGMSVSAIGRQMGINESSVRELLKPGQELKAKVLDSTSEMLKAQVDEKGYIDIGQGVERYLNLSSTKLDSAVKKLQDEEGYTVHYIKVKQLGTGQLTTVKVLAAPNTTYSEVYRNRDNIKQITGYTDDGGESYAKILPPLSVDSKRISVRYAEDGGSAADGVIYVRPGVEDLSLGGARYAQVRVAVDGSHYLKGMAVYKDDLPKGVDLVFNTNKSDTGNKLDAMKPLKGDPTNPFGTVVRQLPKLDENGNPIHGTLRSAMNLVNEEGNWDTWAKSLSSQMLSKQSNALAKQQLDMAAERKRNELDVIKTTENPAVKRRLLESFADDADSSAIHLKAAALPRQENKVILPIESMKENEVHAPTFRDGEKVVLVRFPHAGTFEIPELTVNNRNPEARRLLGNAPDAIGIHSSVAEKLSGADFDGDTVLVIPNNDGAVKHSPALEGLKGFDPKTYKIPDDSPIPRMDARTKGVEMGKISNLITDMQIRGATDDELARAVRHSMVVIDAEKHGLDYKQSAIDNGIPALKKKYQKRGGGASTLISNSGTNSTKTVNRRKQGYKIDPATGKKVYTETGGTYVNREGKVVRETEKVPKLSLIDDAHTLSSGTAIEKIYGDYSNTLKALGNEARKEILATKPIPYSPEAKLKYAKQVERLDAKLNIALKNSPLERQAQIIANAVVRQKKLANPDMTKEEEKKLAALALEEARARTGAGKKRIEIDPDEWEAIQAGAISNNKLTQIISNADLDKLKELATPKTAITMSPANKSRAIAMLQRGYTQAEVAAQLGVSVSTLKRSLVNSD